VIKKLKTIFVNFWFSIVTSAKKSEHQYVPLAIIGLFSFVGYYFIWHTITPGEYENIYLRLLGGFLCFCLIFKDYWPKAIKPILPLYWYTTLLYCFPFFFAFMLFKNPSSYVWLITMMTGLFFLMLLTNWVALTILTILGVGLAWIAYITTTDIVHLQTLFLKTLPTYITVLVAGGIFIYRTEVVQSEKLKTMRALAMDIAHELRTPLLAINLAADNIKYYLTDLTFAYGLAKEAKLPIKELPPSQFKILSSSLDDIEAETNYSNTVINMILANVEQQNIKATDFEKCSISRCIDEALRRYPFQSDEKSLIRWDGKNDFSFMGQELSTIHVLFNLLKNSIYYIREAHKGDIHIWLELGGKYNKLHFRDTGKGISADILPKVFDLFFSNTYHGSGIGLAFCKMVMQSYGGEIECESAEGEFTEFILSFPNN